MTENGCLPCTPDLHSAVEAAFERRDLHDFTTHLRSLAPPEDDPRCLKLLLESCRHPDRSAYLGVLLEVGLDPDECSALMVAATNDNVDALQALVGLTSCRLDELDKQNMSVFHQVVLGKGGVDDKVNCIRALIGQRVHDIRGVINLKNERDETAVLLAAWAAKQINDPRLVKEFLQHRHIDLDNCTKGRKDEARTARQIIVEHFKELIDGLPQPASTHEVTKSDLLTYLENGDEELFCKEVVFFRDVDDRSGNYTLLQCACKHNRCLAVKKLLDRNANPEGTANCEVPPLTIATAAGHAEILQIFIDNFSKKRVKTLFQVPRNEKETLLISLMREWDVPNTKPKYRECLDMLLNTDLGIDINARDENGKSALFYAAMSTDKTLMMRLLVKGAYIGAEKDKLPLKYIPRDVLEEHFNRSVEVVVLPTTSPEYEITFGYDCLVPPRTLIHRDQKANHKNTESPIPLLNDVEKNMVTINNEVREQICTETEPLLFMTRNPDLRPLLKHPVLTSFLKIKWEQLKWFFYFNILFYILFVAFITLHILFMKSRNLPDIPGNETIESSLLKPGYYCDHWLPINNTTDEETIPDSDPSSIAHILYAISIVLWGILVARECFQFAISPGRYLSYSQRENYLELAIILSSACVLFFTWEIRVASAMTILLAWGEMVLLIGKLPALSTYIEMLKTVSHNFFKFLCWYSLLILAFALSFFVLFRDNLKEDNLFVNPGTSVFKTMVMMTGEFEVGDIPFVEFPVFSHLVFVMFVFLIAIVLFNLLNGLAVSDTQEIKNDAELVGYVSRVKLIAYIERMATNHTLLSRISCLRNRVQIFSKDIPYIGHVTPNNCSYTWISPRNSDEKTKNKCRLNKDIVKAAENVIAMKDRPSDMEQVKKQLDMLMEVVRKMERRLESM